MNKKLIKIITVLLVASMVNLMIVHPGIPEVDGSSLDIYHSYVLPHNIEHYSQTLVNPSMLFKAVFGYDPRHLSDSQYKEYNCICHSVKECVRED
jgi:hypothetical protein